MLRPTQAHGKSNTHVAYARRQSYGVKRLLHVTTAANGITQNVRGCHLPGMKHWHNQMSPGFAQTVICQIIQLLYMNQQCQCLIPSNVYQT